MPMADCELEDNRHQPVPATVAQAIILLVMLFFILVGNVYLWVTVLRFKDFHKDLYILLLNLSVSDVLLGGISISLTAYAMLVGRWRIGCVVCRLSGCTWTFGVALGTTSLCALSINRYFRVCKQRWHASLYCSKRMVFHVAATWMLSIAISIPRWLHWKSIEYQPSLFYCTMDSKQADSAFLTFLPLLFIWLPVLLCDAIMYNQYKDIRKKALITNPKPKPKGNLLKKRRKRPWILKTFLNRFPPIIEVPESKEQTASVTTMWVSGQRTSEPELDMESSVDPVEIVFEMEFMPKMTRTCKTGVESSNKNTNSPVQDLAVVHNADRVSASPPASSDQKTVRRSSLSPTVFPRPRQLQSPILQRPSKFKFSPAIAKTEDFQVPMTIMITVMGFFLLFIPVALTFIFENITVLVIPPSLQTTVLMLIYFNSTSHPYVYVCTISAVRRRLLRQVESCCRSRKDSILHIHRLQIT